MLDYIWLDDETPILRQISSHFSSAVILTNPFIQMPKGWSQNRKKNPYEHIYPDHNDIFNYAKPVSWNKILKDTGLSRLDELAIALKTSILALKKEYARSDLADKLNVNMNEDLYYPHEDRISEFIIADLLKVFNFNGSNRIFYSDPISDKSGYLQLNEIAPLDICELYWTEVIITDEKMDYAFMSVYDSFITLFLSKEKNPINIVRKMGWEAIICDDNTLIDWYLNR